MVLLSCQLGRATVLEKDLGMVQVMGQEKDPDWVQEKDPAMVQEKVQETDRVLLRLSSQFLVLDQATVRGKDLEMGLGLVLVMDQGRGLVTVLDWALVTVQEKVQELLRSVHWSLWWVLATVPVTGQEKVQEKVLEMDPERVQETGMEWQLLGLEKDLGSEW